MDVRLEGRSSIGVSRIKKRLATQEMMAETDSTYSNMCHNQAKSQHRLWKVVSKFNKDMWLVMLSHPTMS